MTKPNLESTWRALVKRLPASWSDSSLRHFVHLEARPCQQCGGLTQSSRCERCQGSRFEPLAEVERAHPASLQACAFFAREAVRLTVVEDAARELSGAARQRLRWKTRPQKSAGDASSPHAALLSDASVAIESVTPEAMTLMASGVECPCLEAEWQKRPVHVSRWLGSDDAHADVSVETCTTCGAPWLEYLYEDHFGNGSKYRGLIDARAAHEVTSETAAALLERLPWYWLGGTYYFGKTTRCSGAIRLH